MTLDLLSDLRNKNYIIFKPTNDKNVFLNKLKNTVLLVFESQIKNPKSWQLFTQQLRGSVKLLRKIGLLSFEINDEISTMWTGRRPN